MWLAQSGGIGRLWRRSQFTTDEGSRDPAFAQAHARAGFSFLANEALGTTPCGSLSPLPALAEGCHCRLARRLISVHGIAPPRIVIQRRNHCSQKPSTTESASVDAGPAQTRTSSTRGADKNLPRQRCRLASFGLWRRRHVSGALSHVTMLISQASPAARQSKRISPFSWPRIMPSIARMPKPLRVGGLTGGPFSVQRKTSRPFGSRDHST
jgi:hypothetical protein